MIFLTLFIGCLPIIISYSISFYLLSSDSDIQNLIIATLEEKLANIKSKSIRVLVRFSILILELNSLIFRSISFSSSPLKQQQQQKILKSLQEEKEQEQLEQQLRRQGELVQLQIQQRYEEQKKQQWQQKQQQQEEQQQRRQELHQRPRIEYTKEHEDLFIQCIAQRLGFSKNRPVAACITYKCLRQWRSFQKENTNIFDRIIATVFSNMGIQNNNDEIAYWLSNISTLLFLLQRVFNDNGASRYRRSRISTTFTATRMVQSFRGTRSQDGETVEAKYPALFFEEQLTIYFEKLYWIIRGNFKKDISKLLGLCIQAPRISRLLNLSSGMTATALPSAVSQDMPMAHWLAIVEKIQYFQHLLVSNNVPPFLVRKIFMHIFWFINVQLFNSLLLRRECCSFSNGEYVKAGLFELEHWCYKATEEYAGSAWGELKQIRKAIGFLVMHQKPKKTLDEIAHDMCPVLSLQQLYRISTMYWDDKYGTYSLSTDVILQMRVLMTEDQNTAVNSSFLLDDDEDKSIGFSVDDLYESMSKINIEDVEPPPVLRDNSGFNFLL